MGNTGILRTSMAKHTCSVVGCSRAYLCRGYCRRHYGEKRLTGELPYIREQHGLTRTKEYKAWQDMKKRCNPNNWRDYRWYKDVKVCDEWVNSFEAFYKHIGHCPPGMTLDRMDTLGNYEPGNVRWADWGTQQNNRRKRTEYRRGSDGKFTR